MALHQLAVLQNRFAVRNELIECRQKSGLDVLLIQMRRPAFMVALELLVALPDNAAVFAVGISLRRSIESLRYGSNAEPKLISVIVRVKVDAKEPRGMDALITFLLRLIWSGCC